MSQCEIQLPLKQSPEDFVRLAKTKIGGLGGTFEGDGSGGQFFMGTPLGKISGTYSIEGPFILIRIIEKPVFIGCGKIESLLNEHLVAR